VQGQFWPLSDDQWERISPHLPRDVRGVFGKVYSDTGGTRRCLAIVKQPMICPTRGCATVGWRTHISSASAARTSSSTGSLRPLR
jgi:hypothetical protein